jgi:hypothetical protein
MKLAIFVDESYQGFGRALYLALRRSMETIAQHLGVSRATVYNDAT